MDSFKIYYVQDDYVKFLRSFDDKVTIIKEAGKSRPFVGIIYTINDFKYFAPFSSPEKDEDGNITQEYKNYFKKNNNPTYERIEDLKYGIIRINNMIPIPESEIINFEIDDIQDENYKQILQDQFIYCNNNKTRILHKANKLYNQVTIKKVRHYIQLSCNYSLLEAKCMEYIMLKEVASVAQQRTSE